MGGSVTSATKQQSPRARAFQPIDVPPHLTDAGEIRQPSYIQPSQWRDPDDAVALERGPNGRRHQKTIAGYRAIDPLDRLPCQPDHHKAARRLRQDWERGSGATSGRSEAGYVDGGSRDHDSIAAQLEARRRYQDAVQALGQRACAYVLPVVLSGWTCADLVGKFGGNAMSVQGRVMAGLDRLSEHYVPPKEVATIVPTLLDIDGAVLTEMVDPKVTDLPQDRLGRFKRG